METSNGIVFGLDLNYHIKTIYGVPVRPEAGIPDFYLIRFVRRFVVDESGCWLWVFSVDDMGYAKVSFRNKITPVHRISYILFNGDIANGNHVHHTCENRNCVNPAHLQSVTPEEHVALTPNCITHAFAAQETCIHGHPLSGDNVYLEPRSNKRRCRACRLEWGRQKYARDAADRKPKQTCKRGHPWIPENWVTYHGRKQCRLCKQITLAAFKKRSADLGYIPKAILESEEYCRKGHELTPENLYVTKKGKRHCLACQREYQQAYYPIKRSQR